MDSAKLIEDQHFAALLEAAGETPDLRSVVSCAGGGNNRVFIIHANGRRLIAKWYFSHPSDSRNRLRAEYTFLDYAHHLGLTCVPKPLACLPDERMALYEFIDGSKFQPDGVATHHIGDAIKFFLRLNGPERRRMKDTLPDASEAYFSITTQISAIQRRIARLSDIIPATPVDEAAMHFINRLRRAFDSTAVCIAETAGNSDIDVDAVLADEFRCISPSDFGFHNALLGPDGKLYFLDFEYAGWDDPAKMACDFFCQPAVPVDERHFDDFLKRVMAFSSDPASLITRARIMLPLFRMKWCCIVLNEFLPESAQRRRFADPSADPEECKRVQLSKANRLLDAISQ
jgi:hypothetical protein